MKKRIVLHIGAHKTGTTYLQSVFSQNVEFLNSKGIDYPYAETESTIQSGACVGNIIRMLYLNNFIAQKRNSRKPESMKNLWTSDCARKIADITRSSNFPIVLFSSEGMSQLSTEHVQDLKAILDKEFEVEIIIFVRDPFDYFYSSWRQVIKGYMSEHSFENYVARIITNSRPYNKGMFSAFSTYLTLGFNMKVINYDTYKKALSDNFFILSGLLSPEQMSGLTTIGSIENRSLSPSESELMLHVNRTFNGKHFPAVIRHALLSRNKHTPEVKSYYDPKIHQQILSSLTNEIALINERLIGEKLATTCSNIEATPISIEKADIETFIQSFKFVLESTLQRKSLSAVIRHIWKRVLYRNIPSDFSAEAYLTLNNDITEAGADPYLHYSKNGYKEGRPYRYY